KSGLFVPPAPEPEKLELTLARIAAIVGKNNIGAPELHDTYARNRFDMQHFGIRGRATRIPNSLGTALMLSPIQYSSSTAPNSGAFRIFRPPLEATVRVLDAVPAWIAFSGMHGDIAAASGPWHSEGEWWHGSWARE